MTRGVHTFDVLHAVMADDHDPGMVFSEYISFALGQVQRFT